VIKNYLKKDILKSSAKPIMIKVCLCFLAFDDLVGAAKVEAWIGRPMV
jgi:hypothetical protein